MKKIRIYLPKKKKLLRNWEIKFFQRKSRKELKKLGTETKRRIKKTSVAYGEAEKRNRSYQKGTSACR